jgi:glycosyltransferase involved in cell wall biosynthesis
MMIGIDASRANERQKTGTEWYAYHLIQALKKLDDKNSYTLYSFDPLQDGLEDLPPNFKSRVLRSVTDVLWTQLRLSIEMLFRPSDVLFVPAHTIPLIHPKATVLTVHDLGFEYFPDLYKKVPIGLTSLRWLLEIGARIVTLGRYGNSEYDYHRWAMRFGVKHATRIIAISEFTKKDVVKRFGADPERVIVVGHGFDQSLYRPQKEGEKVKSRRILQLRPYILFVGRIEKKKNVDGLLRAYHLLRSRLSKPYKLALIGKPGFGYEGFRDQVRGFPPVFRRDIHFLGWVPEDETAEFYRNAALFAFPSYFEGFGIPVIQAMASGVPVVCSNTTSLPEIAGDAALLVNPDDPEKMAETMQKVMQDSRLQDLLIDKGIRRAQKFSWEESARKTLKVIQQAYAQTSR